MTKPRNEPPEYEELRKKLTFVGKYGTSEENKKLISKVNEVLNAKDVRTRNNIITEIKAAGLTDDNKSIGAALSSLIYNNVPVPPPAPTPWRASLPSSAADKIKQRSSAQHPFFETKPENKPVTNKPSDDAPQIWKKGTPSRPGRR